MQGRQFVVEAFDQDYPLTLEAIQRSEFLKNAFSGRYKEQDRIELNLDPLLQPAWDAVYQQLLVPRTEGTWSSLQFLPSSGLWDLFQLAEYLQINDLIDDFRKLIVNGNVSTADLSQFYDRYRQYPTLVQAAAVIIIRGGNRFDQLPSWVQAIFSSYQTNFPPNGFLLTRLQPLDYRDIYLNRSILNEKYGPQYDQVCPERQQPHILTSTGLVRLGRNLIVNEVDNLYLSCPAAYPHFSMVNGTTPCCRSGPRRGLNFNQVEIPWDQIGDRVAMMGQGGFLVFVPAGFQGDYIFTYNYNLLPEIKAVVV